MSLDFHLPEHTVHQTYSVFPSDAETQQRIGYNLSQYHLDQIHDYWTGEGVNVGICDTGVDVDHEDLNVAVFDDGWDNHGHGTHVAGIVCSKNNKYGALGVAPDCNLVSAQAMTLQGGDDDSVADAIDFCVQHKCQIINLSFQTLYQKPKIAQQIKQAAKRGILLVAASGNSGKDIMFPGRMGEVISVGAINKEFGVAHFSSWHGEKYGGVVDCVGPGVNIFSSYSGNTYAVMSGTSQAAPWVTGLLALLTQAYSGDTELARRALFENCTTELLSTPNKAGRGVPNVAALLRSLAGADEDKTLTTETSQKELVIDISNYSTLKLS